MSEKPSIESSIQNNRKGLMGFIRKRVNTNEDAEDILQDVWYQLSRLVNFEEIENITSWLYRVARNRITDFYRKSSEESYDDWLTQEDESEWKEILFGEPENATQEMFKELFWDELMSALGELPQNQQEVFVKTEIDGMKLREVAEEIDEPLKTIISRKGYAVKHLRNRLKKLYDEL